MAEQRPTIPQPNRPQVVPNAHPGQPHPAPQPVHPHPNQPHAPLRQPTAAPAPSTLPKVGAMPTQARHDEDLDPIGLVDELDTVTAEKTIKAFGITGAVKARDFKRKCVSTGTGACRMKTFHGKLSDQGMQYLDDAVNDWLDNHPEVEVKFVTSSVGVFEGKIREPALVLNLWY
jgi:hypothetical protein